jgi:xanthine dehydrogenase accessory factor
MNGRDEDLTTLATAVAWAQAGHGVAIATVITTWGSAPRREGSHLAIRADGLFEGSVSGGCVEADVILAAQDMISAQAGHAVLDYGVADTVAWTAGLACGGRISILVQRLADDALPPALVADVLAATSAGRMAAISSDPATGRAAAGEHGPFVRRYPPQALVPLADGLGVVPAVIDPRGLFAADARFAGLELDRRWPDEALEAVLNPASAVVALTHDPKIDDVALAAALRSPAYYIAALGSRKNHAGRLERLAAQGFGPDDLARIHGPAGLAIGATGPAEIALSIAAQMTAAWRNALTP